MRSPFQTILDEDSSDDDLGAEVSEVGERSVVKALSFKQDYYV